MTENSKVAEFISSGDYLQKTEVIRGLPLFLQGGSLNDTALLNHVGRHPEVCQRVLKSANSGWLGTQSLTSSLQETLTRLGPGEFASLVMAEALKEGAGEGSDTAIWWKSTELAARTCQLFAQFLQTNLESTAFATALLHDCPVPLMSRSLPDYRYLRPEALLHGSSVVELELDSYGFHHAQVASALAGHWGYPREIQEAIQNHHQPRALEKLPRESAVLLCLLLLTKTLLAQYSPELPASAGIELDLVPRLAKTLKISPDEVLHATSEIIQLLHLRTQHS